MSPPGPVSSYLTFSPFPFAFAQGGYFLLHFYTLADIFPLGSMVLSVARTFLPRFGFHSAGTMEQPAEDAKLRKKPLMGKLDYFYTISKN